MLFYSTGQAARELGVSQDQIRLLCHAKAIKAEFTAGGQYRIAQADVERLKRQGVPPAPRPLPVDPELEPQEGRGRRPRGDASDPDIRDALRGEEVRVHELSLKAEQLRRQRALNLEQERLERQQERQQRQKLEQSRAEQARRDRERAAARRRQEIAEWEEYARYRSYWAEADERSAIYQAVRARLESLDPLPAREVCESIVAGILAAARRKLEAQRESERAVAETMEGLPWQLRSGSDSENERAGILLAVHQALRQLPQGASLHEKRAAAQLAAAPMTARFLHRYLFKEAAGRLLNNLAGSSQEEQEGAFEAMARAWNELPVGATANQVESACRAAIAPFIKRLQQKREQEQREAQDGLRRESAAFTVLLQIGRVEARVKELVDSGDLAVKNRRDLLETAATLKNIIRPELEDWVFQHYGCDRDAVSKEIDRLVDVHLDEVTEQAGEEEQ